MAQPLLTMHSSNLSTTDSLLLPKDMISAIAVVTYKVNEAILSAVVAKCGLRLLDVACKTGWLSAAAVKREAIVTGLDFAENMVAIARVRCPKAQFHNGDAENLTFESSQFEAVVCSLGILHFQNPERVIAEFFRVLKPGGSYAFTYKELDLLPQPNLSQRWNNKIM